MSLTRYLVPPSKEEYSYYKCHPKYVNKVCDYKYSFTYRFLHHVMSQLFHQVQYGTFIEAGASDGQFQTNTLDLEVEQHWTGLLIEPEPRSFELLLKKNRKSWSANLCLSPHPYPYRVSEVIQLNDKYAGIHCLFSYQVFVKHDMLSHMILRMQSHDETRFQHSL